MASFHNWTGDEEIDKQVPQFLNEDNAATQEKLNAKFNKSYHLAKASDLNSIRNEGFYTCGSNNDAETMLNCPTEYAFGLMVWGTGEIVYQEVREYNRSSKNQDNNNCWRRSYYTSGNVQNTWSNWQKMAYTATTLAGYGITDGMRKDVTNRVSVEDIVQMDVNTTYLSILGGNSFDKCASFQLYGGESTSNTGQFVLRAKDLTHSVAFFGSPSGILRWDAKNIVRSVNNFDADNKGNVTIPVDTAMSSTSTNPVQNKVIKGELNYLSLESGQLAIPSDSRSYISKVATNSFAPINDRAHLIIEQSADGDVWETLFDSSTTTDNNYKLAYLNGLKFPSQLRVAKGYMARIRLAVPGTLYFSSLAFFVRAINNTNSDLKISYKCYVGLNGIKTNVYNSGGFSTYGSWVSTIFKAPTYNNVMYVFNEDKQDVTLFFQGVLCKGTDGDRSVLNFDQNNMRTVTSYPVQAPTFIGRSTQDNDGNPINTTYVKKNTANTWTAQQNFHDLMLNREKYTTYVVANTSDKPVTSTMVYAVTSAFTLDLSVLAGALSASQSSIFTAYFAANADYSLTISNAGKLKYVGSASDVAITSAGLLLNIWMSKDGGGTLTSIVQASKLS